MKVQWVGMAVCELELVFGLSSWFHQAVRFELVAKEVVKVEQKRDKGAFKQPQD